MGRPVQESEDGALLSPAGTDFYYAKWT